MKAIISGGGTGGHIFPAIAIANAIKGRYPDADILFVGAEGRMEMEKVPAAGYKIEGLPIAGLQRKLTLKNLALPFKLLKSQRKVKRILRDFAPDIVVGVGGYASAPTLKMASKMGFKTLLQEQNSFPGLTNKMLAKKAEVICVAYDGLQQYFPANKIVFTGNPVRDVIERMDCTHEQGAAHFGCDPTKPIVLSVGGSLGAGSINNMLMSHLQHFRDNKVQLIWQTGKWMYEEAALKVKNAGLGDWIKVHQFISHMEMAYAAANVVVSRAGAIAISELCIVGKPAVLIPSPNVAEDHQTKNALALASKGAAVMVRDAECKDTGVQTVLDLIVNPTACAQMSKNIRNFARPHSAELIVDEIEKVILANNSIA